MSHVLTVCASCPDGAKIAAELADLKGFSVTTTECMSGCRRPSAIAFRAPGKVAYLFGAITPDDRPEIETFAAAYLASTDGTFADARPFGRLREKALARIPG